MMWNGSWSRAKTAAGDLLAFLMFSAGLLLFLLLLVGAF